MQEDLSIWSPVIMTGLRDEHNCQQHNIYIMEEGKRRLEHIKAKLRNCQAHLQGRNIELLIEIDLLCLLENEQGKTDLLNRKEVLKEHVPLREFDRPIKKEEELEFIIDISNLYCEGQIRGQELDVAYFFNYNLMAVKEQVVNLSQDGIQEKQMLDDFIEQLEKEISQLQDENQKLSRKILFYERNIASLKRAVQKAESRNAMLERQLLIKHKELENMQGLMQKEKLTVAKIEDYKNNEVSEEEMNLGSKIKRLFMNNT